jgi:hypothetical protein
VDNSAPPAPVGLSATPVQSGRSTFTLTWGEPQGQVAPITGALYQVCPASRSGACSTPTAAPAGGPASVTVPGPGDWSIAVWLSNAAGNANPADAAHASVVVPAPGSGGPGPGHTTTGTPRIHVTEALQGRELIVHVSGPASGKVRVGFTGRLKGKLVVSAAKTVALKRGRLTVTFTLGPRTAAHALVRISARLDHDAAVTSTLHRQHRSAR